MFDSVTFPLFLVVHMGQSNFSFKDNRGLVLLISGVCICGLATNNLYLYGAHFE